jgi:molybdopterin converting factor subunit 1
MTITVLLFARARELVGCDLVNLEVAEGAVVADVRRALVSKYPALAGLVEVSAVAVNQEYAEDEMPIPKAAEVARIPPVSGG